MKLSIIIPIHNGEKFIDRCVNALLNQTVEIDEIILVNDHSSDRTEEICKGYESQNDSIKYVESYDYGVSAARNTGLNCAKGDILGFCDVDDIEKKPMAEIVKRAFETDSNLKLLITGYERVDCDDISRVFGVYKCANIERWTKEDYLKHTIYDENIMGTVCCKFFAASLLRELRFNENLSLCEDMDFALRAMIPCPEESIKAIDRVTYQYSFNPRSVTNDETKLYGEGHNDLRYNEAFFSMACNDMLSAAVREYLYYKVFCFSIAILSYYSISEPRKNVLKQHVKKFFPVYIRLFEIEPRENIKRGIKYLFRIRKGRPFSW